MNDNVYMRLNACKLFASSCHKHQVDKAGKPYINHPISVMNRVKDLYDKIYKQNVKQYYKLPELERVQMVAILHDVIEDCGVTDEQLYNIGLHKDKTGIPDYSDIVEGIHSVTRNENESYGDFVKRASLNKYGLLVKYCDIEDNLDLTRLESISEKDIPRINKYLKWHKYLHNIIFNNENN